MRSFYFQQKLSVTNFYNTVDRIQLAGYVIIQLVITNNLIFYIIIINFCQFLLYENWIYMLFYICKEMSFNTFF